MRAEAREPRDSMEAGAEAPARWPGPEGRMGWLGDVFWRSRLEDQLTDRGGCEGKGGGTAAQTTALPAFLASCQAVGPGLPPCSGPFVVPPSQPGHSRNPCPSAPHPHRPTCSSDQPQEGQQEGKLRTGFRSGSCSGPSVNVPGL